MSQATRVECQLGGRTLSIETGHLAKQASGSVIVQCGDTMVLVTVCASPEAKEGIDFLPLTVDYVEKTFAAGKIPGGFLKREGRLSERETLTSRLIDRPIRPLFPEGWACETQVIATVLSADPDDDPDTLAIIGASAALTISDIPFNGPIAGCRVSCVNGEVVINPTLDQLDESEAEIIIAASDNALVMVEGGARELSEEALLNALLKGHEALKPVIAVQQELAEKLGVQKREVSAVEKNEDLAKSVAELAKTPLEEAFKISTKLERYEAVRAVKKDLVEQLVNEETSPADIALIGKYFKELESDIMRKQIVEQKVRIDGRDLETVRPITIDLGLLPRAHGSAVFTRGETQALVTATLGTSDDVQIVDTLLESGTKHFMLHYNFPPFSVGEVKFLRGPGRREIGHGALAERAVTKVLPSEEDFPYTLRIVSEILESNGSSSMATVCGASLALMDAGVPTKAAVAGIAMGLIKEDGQYVVLSDILGDEDHLGDMDFKVAGTEQGVTALQMDIKIEGLPLEVMEQALAQAKRGRLHILGEMKKAIVTSREELSPYAPRIESMKINPDKIRDIIGPGGKMIRSIIDQTGVKIDVEDSGVVQLYSSNLESIKKARKLINDIVEEAVEGRVYRGKVRKIMDFGAFVEILPGTDGLLHISQIANDRINKVTDVLHEGDEVIVKCIRIDRDGKISLSKKEAEGLVPDSEKE
ncbi:MAG: polyribonucleotide nucleotidyltransferase [Deltaproteobacteria bacterium]|nr:polyribonucleotide nucleotidyltransferase [Deltaproteobacteria bacterium]